MYKAHFRGSGQARCDVQYVRARARINVAYVRANVIPIKIAFYKIAFYNSVSWPLKKVCVVRGTIVHTCVGNLLKSSRKFRIIKLKAYNSYNK